MSWRKLGDKHLSDTNWKAIKKMHANRALQLIRMQTWGSWGFAELYTLMMDSAGLINGKEQGGKDGKG